MGHSLFVHVKDHENSNFLLLFIFVSSWPSIAWLRNRKLLFVHWSIVCTCTSIRVSNHQRITLCLLFNWWMAKVSAEMSTINLDQKSVQKCMYNGLKFFNIWNFNHPKYICIDACACCNQWWQALAFVPLLTSSTLTKPGIIYTQGLQVSNDTQMTDWVNWAWNMHKNSQKFEWKTLWQELPISMMLSWGFLNWSWVEARPLQQKYKKRKKRKAKIKTEKPKDLHKALSKFWFVHIPSKSGIKHDPNGKKGMLSCSLAENILKKLN